MDEVYNKSKEYLKEKLESFWSIDKPQDQIWVIKYKNEIIELPSKKSAWKKINHAKSALRNALNFSYQYFGYKYGTFDSHKFDELKEKAYQDLLNSGDIEFVNLLEEK